MTYNSRDADGSRAQLDTGMGYGWTHSYNIFLFSQLSAMFRYDGDGRVTKYTIDPAAGSPGPTLAPFPSVYKSDTGYFERLVKNADGTFTLTQKDQTKWTFALIPNTPFFVGGPVYRLTKIEDRNKDTVMLSYTAGDLTSIKDTYGRTLRLVYNTQHKLISVIDPLNRTTTLTYDSTGRRLTAITDALGKRTQYTYNFLYQLTRKVDRDGRVFSYSYAGTNPISSKDGSETRNFSQSNPNNWAIDANALAMTQCLVYTPSTTTKTDGRGNLWKYQYDSRGYVTAMIAPDNATWRYTYDPATLKVSTVTDANAHTTRYEYDSQGNRTRTTDARSNVTTYTYEPVFNMIDQRDGSAEPGDPVPVRRQRQPYGAYRSPEPNRAMDL
jgi:YD repeat-containing protein